MDETPFFRPITGELSQRDVFERLPLLLCKDNPLPLKKATLPGKREGFEAAEPLSPTAPPEAGSPLLVAASCDHTRGLWLTYDCEIDKPSTKLLTVALIRPLDPRMSEKDKAITRQHQKISFFYLPPQQEGEPESYVDCRRIGAVGIEVVKAARRLARLSETARNAMLFQFFRYLTRIDLSKASLPAPDQEPAE